MKQKPEQHISDPDIERWKEQLKRGELSWKDFQLLMRGKNSLKKMKEDK